ncbi:MAG: glycosyltransferase family 39 protein, partial [Nitrospinae bacterium]|nr:glycosyltransferase family 39 protein [Nitrospinota bacterium]
MLDSNQPSVVSDGRNRSVIYILALLILAGFAFRIYTSAGRFERGDSIIVALMANDIAQGIEYPLWYYSGAYAGTLEAWLTVPLIWLTGPSWWVIPFAPLVISTVGIAAFYMLASAIGGSRTGLFAAALWAFVPWGASFYNVSPRGCYPEILCGGAMILWYATRRWQGAQMSVATSFAIGILAGVLIWLRLLVAPYVITLVIILLVVDRTRFLNSRNMAGLAGILIGTLPFLLSWKRVMEQPAMGKMTLAGIGERFNALYKAILTGYLPNVKASAWIVAASKASVFFSLGIVLVFVSIMLFMLVRRTKNPRQINTIPLVLFTFIFAGMYIADTASLTAQVRYSLPLYTAFIVFPALAGDWLAGRSRFVGVALIIFLAGTATAVTKINFDGVKREEADIADRVRKSVAELEKIGASAVIINDFVSISNDDYNYTQRFFYEALTRGYPLNVMQNRGNLNLRWTMAVERDADPVFL